jgi:hypothetical protein
MTRSDKQSRVDPARRRWTAPRMRRLATSSAAFGAATNLDAEGFS